MGLAYTKPQRLPLVLGARPQQGAGIPTGSWAPPAHGVRLCSSCSAACLL